MFKDGEILYQPGPETVERTRIAGYIRWLSTERDLHFDGYPSLWQWSVDDLDAFWRSIWDYFGVQSTTPVGAVLGRREMPGAEWFPGTRINFVAEYLRAGNDREAEIAIVGESQTRDQVVYTNSELVELIGRVRAGLDRLGVRAGDRVVAYIHAQPA